MLYLFYEGFTPLGIFDFYGVDTSEVTSHTVEGGMIGFFSQYTHASPVDEIPLGDGFDEYGAGGAADVKPVISPFTDNNVTAYVSAGGTATNARPLIMDDGSAGYGTMFGKYFGHDSGTADYKYFHSWRDGLQVGPNTVQGSGKVTGWFREGLYGTEIYSEGESGDNTFDSPETPPLPGTPLYVESTTARLTTVQGASPFDTVVAYFVGFLGDPSYVSTSFAGNVGADTTTPIMLFMWKNAQ